MSQNTLMTALEAAFQAAVRAEVDLQLTEIKQHQANILGALAEKVAAMEAKLVEAQLFERTTQVDVQLDESNVVAAIDRQWFWDKLRLNINYEALAESLSDDQLRRIGRQAAQMIDWASAVDWAEALDYSEIVSAIDLEELAGEFDLSAIAAEIDLQESVHEFFTNNQVTISV